MARAEIANVVGSATGFCVTVVTADV